MEESERTRDCSKVEGPLRMVCEVQEASENTPYGDMFHPPPSVLGLPGIRF